MISIAYAPSFAHQFEKLENDFQEEIIHKISLLKDRNNHKLLKVHKLHGKFLNCYSFSVNYRTRVVFEYISRNEIVLLSVGDHDIYRD